MYNRCHWGWTNTTYRFIYSFCGNFLKHLYKHFEQHVECAHATSVLYPARGCEFWNLWWKFVPLRHQSSRKYCLEVVLSLSSASPQTLVRTTKHWPSFDFKVINWIDFHGILQRGLRFGILKIIWGEAWICEQRLTLQRQESEVTLTQKFKYLWDMTSYWKALCKISPTVQCLKN